MLDLLAHTVKRTVDPVALGLDIIGHHLIDGHAWLVEYGDTSGQPFDQFQA